MHVLKYIQKEEVNAEEEWLKFKGNVERIEVCEKVT